MNLIVLLSLLIGIGCVHVQGVRQTAHSKSNTLFSGVVEVVCEGLDTNKLDDISMTVFSQALEDSYDDLDNTKTNGTYINADWGCVSYCGGDDRFNPKKRRPRLQNGEKEETLKFEVDWVCGDLCPDDSFVASTFTPSTSVMSGSLRGVPQQVPSIEGDANVAEWEKNLIHKLIDTRRNDFKAVEVCKIMSVTSGKLSVA